MGDAAVTAGLCTRCAMFAVDLSVGLTKVSVRRNRWNLVDSVVLQHNTLQYYAHSKSWKANDNWKRLKRKASKVIKACAQFFQFAVVLCMIPPLKLMYGTCCCSLERDWRKTTRRSSLYYNTGLKL